jgi:hypothetical protein
VPTLEASSRLRRGSGVTAVALVSGLACLPREDLGDYSRTWANQPASGAGTSVPPDAGADAGGSAGAGASAPDAGSGSGAPVRAESDAGLVLGPEDAGAPDAAIDAAVAPIDGGAIVLSDAGPELAASCADLNGSLEPGTRNCFVVSSSAATWQDAADGCIALGMQLAKVTTRGQDSFIATLTPAAVWLGARDPAFFNFPAFANPAANAFSWLDGSVVADINWATGEPNAGVGEFCVEKSNDAGGEPWFDRNCNQLERYVCQLAL